MGRSGFSRWLALLLGVGVLVVFLAAGLLFVLSGQGRRDPVASTHDPHEIVAQMRVGGGLVPPLNARLDSFPTFTLYGDGTTIYPVGYRYYQGHLDEAAIQRLLSLAVYDVRFLSLAPNVGPIVMDAGSLTIMLNAAGQSHQSSMSTVNEGNDADVARLRRLSDAIDGLRNGNDPAYVPPAVLLYAQHDVAPGSASPSAPPWPLADIALASVYQATWQMGTGLRLTGAPAQAALQAAAQPQPFTQNGQRYLVVAVPTLP